MCLLRAARLDRDWARHAQAPQQVRRDLRGPDQMPRETGKSFPSTNRLSKQEIVTLLSLTAGVHRGRDRCAHRLRPSGVAIGQSAPM